MNKEKEAAVLVSTITKEMDVIENRVYHKMCRFYKGDISIDNLKVAGEQDFREDAVLYGLGNWYLYNGQEDKAKKYYEKLLKSGNKVSFAYIAAEADYNRLLNAFK